jgi:ribosomal protein L31E
MLAEKGTAQTAVKSVRQEVCCDEKILTHEVSTRRSLGVVIYVAGVHAIPMSAQCRIKQKP